MGFEDDLAAEKRSTNRCKIDGVRERMNKEDRASLDAAMDDHDRIPTEVIIRALKRDPNNPLIGRKVVIKHRQRECSCFNEGTA